MSKLVDEEQLDNCWYVQGMLNSKPSNGDGEKISYLGSSISGACYNVQAARLVQQIKQIL